MEKTKIKKILVGIMLAVCVAIITIVAYRLITQPKAAGYAKDDYTLENNYNMSVSDVQQAYDILGKYSGICYWYTRSDSMFNDLTFQGTCIGYGMSDQEFQTCANNDMYGIESNNGFLWLFTLNSDGTMVPLYTNTEIIISSTPLS